MPKIIDITETEVSEKPGVVSPPEVKVPEKSKTVSLPDVKVPEKSKDTIVPTKEKIPDVDLESQKLKKKLRILKEMLEEEIITKEEYDNKRKELLSKF